VTPGSPALRALLVHRSPEAGRHLSEMLESDSDITVLGPVGGATEAVRRAQQDHPDVVVLDLQLGDEDSQHAIEQIMALIPTPILVLSRPGEDAASPAAVAALRAGALDVLSTPAEWTTAGAALLRRSVRRLDKVVVIRHPRGGLNRPTTPRPASAGRSTAVVAVGASTGGPSALACLLGGLAGLAAPVLVVQHLHADFTGGFLTWMSRASALPVEIARHRGVLEPGHVYLAPGDLHLRLGPDGRIDLASLPVSLHRPSADQLFHSLAENAGAGSIGVLMTGMGEDGARGLLEIHRKGGRTLAQDEASSAVFGMPRAAQRLGAVTDLLPLDRLAGAICRAVAEVRG
jgi:two-component system chemotaxis response regulator CheB